LLIGAQKIAEKDRNLVDEQETSGRVRQASALRFVCSDQLQDLGLKCVLRGINRADRLGERLLLELILNGQTEFS
jgi:hypothetical protein